MIEVETILDFWFGNGDPDDVANARFSLWFGANPELDQVIATKFQTAIEDAALGRLEAWKETARGRLAWTILLDQFTRNAYRGHHRTYAFDALALQSTREAIRLRQHLELPVIQRGFLYLPLEHAEDLAAQEQSVALYRALEAETPPGLEKIIATLIDYAERHATVVRRFGHYPHRNQILGRDSTEDEIAFLASPAAPF